MRSLLATLVLVLAACGGSAVALADELFPIYPPYPYRAGYYPKADWYYGMPPYVAMRPSFHRKRFFMVAQERNRYRYMPHIFRGYPGYGGGEGIEEIDIQAVSASLGSGVYGGDTLK